MKCPKCAGWFESVEFNGVQLDRCTNCKGLWFDMLEKEDLLRMEGAEAIDIGNEQVGEKYDRMRSISCPQCEVLMIPMIDKDQFHIHYECCPTCYGTFFDAGEFRDLKEITIAERFEKMLAALRSHL